MGARIVALRRFSARATAARACATLASACAMFERDAGLAAVRCLLPPRPAPGRHPARLRQQALLNPASAPGRASAARTDVRPFGLDDVLSSVACAPVSTSAAGDWHSPRAGWREVSLSVRPECCQDARWRRHRRQRSMMPFALDLISTFVIGSILPVAPPISPSCRARQSPRWPDEVGGRSWGRRRRRRPQRQHGDHRPWAIRLLDFFIFALQTGLRLSSWTDSGGSSSLPPFRHTSLSSARPTPHTTQAGPRAAGALRIRPLGCHRPRMGVIT